MEIEGSLLVLGLCPVSAITQEPNENPIAFLERPKEVIQKFTSLDLDTYKGDTSPLLHVLLPSSLYVGSRNKK